MSAYYNEFDPFAAAWLRELIKAGLIAPGDVDERSITEVQADDVRPYTQAHFFAGIGGWSYALRLAGWPDDRPVWTGSCPCQPFSSAGKGASADDPRHFWPTWFRLIRECRPDPIFGEQVASADGRAWLDLVSTDLEGSGYAVGALDLPAGCVGAPHIRQRFYFVADAEGASLPSRAEASNDSGRSEAEPAWAGASTGRRRGAGALANTEGRNGRLPIQRWRSLQAGLEPERHGSHRAWSDVEWIPCGDGKARPIKPGLEPLVDGLPGRLDILRGYGNAIVPQVAAEVIGAYMEIAQ